MTSPLMFVASLVFLVGIVLVIASAAPQFEERAGALLGSGFLVAVVGIAMAVLVAIFAS